MSDDEQRIPPHAVILRGPSCPQCGSDEFDVVAIPKLSTGELYPVAGHCESCDARVDMRGSDPIPAMAVSRRSRWDLFEVAELQQLFGAAQLANLHELFGAVGTGGNLLAKLADEIGKALDARITLEDRLSDDEPGDSRV